jgi:predicted nicotinamide N-methyase
MDVATLTRQLRRTLPDGRMTPIALPLCPEIELYLVDASNMPRSFAIEDIQIILANTPYWVFCWASGQALAYYILQKKQAVAGKRVLDFGSGSGVVAVAAALAGAATVIACDVDPDALAAVQANAALNNVRVDTCRYLAETSGAFDMIIAADVLYDYDNRHYLEQFVNEAPEVVVADSRVKTIDVAPYRRIGEIQTTTIPDLEESEEFNRVGIYRAMRGA